MGDRQAVFFDFSSKRLAKLRGNGYFSYLDAFHDRFEKPAQQRPYLYLSSYKTMNDYNHYGSTDCPNNPGAINGLSAAGDKDIWPYCKSHNPMSMGGIGFAYVYLNPITYQIISSGRDGKFGPGSTNPTPKTLPPYFWREKTAASIHPDGRDDQANFARGGCCREGSDVLPSHNCKAEPLFLLHQRIIVKDGKMRCQEKGLK